jgi:hypothetical protein
MSAIHRAADHPTGVRPAFVGREVSRYRPRRRRQRLTHRQRETFMDGLLALAMVAAGLVAIWWVVLGMMP